MSCLRKPDWLKVRLPAGENYARIKDLLRSLQLHTVCEEARCPNVHECWGGGTATVMLMGDICTRGCRFCAVKSGNPRGYLDPLEPWRVALALQELDLDYVVITSVNRDDLQDGGAGHFAETIRAIRQSLGEIIVEALIPDFQGDPESIRKVAEARPDVISHNLETTERLTPLVRDRRASYHQSLSVLQMVKRFDGGIITKSSIMLGLGESEGEVLKAMEDLKRAGVEILTLGQYLRPSPWHIEVKEYLPPERFEYFKERGEEMGFLYVASGPLVRSSYRAGEFFLKHVIGGKSLNEKWMVRTEGMVGGRDASSFGS